MASQQGPGSNLSFGPHPALKPIETRRAAIVPREGTIEGKRMANSEKTPVDEPLSPAARLFHTPNFNCFIVAIIGYKTAIDIDVFKAQLERTWLKHPRMSSIMVVKEKKGAKPRWVRTGVDLDNHIIVPDSNHSNMGSPPDLHVEDYISNLTTTFMDLSKPLWEVHILNIKTSDANATAVFKIHHSIGDGAFLISLVQACARDSFDPAALPAIGARRPRPKRDSGFWSFLVSVWSFLWLWWNTLVDLLMLGATLLFWKDSKSPLKGANGVEHNPKRIVQRVVSLDDIKLVKKAMNATINDVILGVTQAALSRYLSRRYSKDEKKKNNLLKRIHLRSMLMVNTRPSTGIEGSTVKWGNHVGFVILPITIALRDDPLDYVRESKTIADRKKHSLEAFFSLPFAAYMIKFLGLKVAAAVTRRVFFNVTMLLSNVAGPAEEISFCGHPVAYLAFSAFGHPQALTFHCVSYGNKMTIALSVDQGVMPDPHEFCDDLEESLKLLKNAAIQEELTNNS